jgi:hypothetical protein
MVRIIGIVLFAVGLVLLVFGLNASNSVGEQVVETVTGRFTETTMWYIVGGIAALVGGGALAFFGDRVART